MRRRRREGGGGIIFFSPFVLQESLSISGPIRGGVRVASVYMNILPAAKGIMPLISRPLLSEICEDTDFAISP